MTTDQRRMLAAEAWRAILDFIGATAWQRTRILADLGLSVNDSRALTSLEAEGGRTMGSLAEEWSCDASTATWIVGRLERRGLVERQAPARDRRLRLVALTPTGLALREEMLHRMYTPPAELLELEPADLEALRDGAIRLPSATNDMPSPRADSVTRPDNSARIRSPSQDAVSLQEQPPALPEDR
jgi:DNA-binding MarR family transcriptional regulator